MKICVKEGYRRKEEAKNHNTYIIHQTPIVTHTQKKTHLTNETQVTHSTKTYMVCG